MGRFFEVCRAGGRGSGRCEFVMIGADFRRNNQGPSGMGVSGFRGAWGPVVNMRSQVVMLSGDLCC